jgi:CRISPR system Cascade subunit CasD
VAALAEALARPVRPLFIGRKTCLPAAPLLLRRIEAEHVLHALRREPRFRRPARRSGLSPTYNEPDPAGAEMLEACWPAHLGEAPKSRVVPIYDRRDWRNQIHAGRRLRVEGWLEMAP